MPLLVDIVNVIQNNMNQNIFTCGIFFFDWKKGLWYREPFNLTSKNLIIMASEKLSMTGLPRTFPVFDK